MYVGKIVVDLEGQYLVASWFEPVTDDIRKFVKNTFYKAGDSNLAKEELGSVYEEILLGFKPLLLVPSKVTMRQARHALLDAGLLPLVEQSLTDGKDLIDWEYATEVYRNSGLVSRLSEALGLSELEVDKLFIEASKV